MVTKERLKEYLKDKFDVTLEKIFADLGLKVEDLPQLEFCLDELVDEGWLQKTSMADHFEYNPGEKFDFGIEI
jgi:hypothetical protein